MPTLKAIHICNYSRILNLFFGVRELTFRTSQRPLMRKLHRVPRLITHIRFKTFTAMLFEQAKKT